MENITKEISMPSKLQSTLIKKDGPDSAMVELMIAEKEAATTTHAQYISAKDHEQFGSHDEIVFLRVRVPANHNFLSGFQCDAIKHAITILENEITKLKK